MMFPPIRREQLSLEEARNKELQTFRSARAQHTQVEEQRAAAHQQELVRLNKSLAFSKEVKEKLDARKVDAERRRGDASRSDAFSGMADVERTLVRLGLDANSTASASAAAGIADQQQQQKAAVSGVSLPSLINSGNLKGVVLGGQTKRVVQTDSDIDAARKRSTTKKQQQALQNDEKLAAIREKKQEDEQHTRDRIKRQYILDVEAGRAAEELREREERSALLLRARNLFSTERDRVFERLRAQAGAEVEKLMTERVVQAQAALFNARALTEEEHIVETARERRRIATEKFEAERADAQAREAAEKEVRVREDTAFARALVVGIVNITGDIIEHNEAMMLESHSGTPHDPVTVSHWRQLCDKHLGAPAREREERRYLEALLEAERGELQAEEEAEDDNPLSPKNRSKIGNAVLGARGDARRMTVAAGGSPRQHPQPNEHQDTQITKLLSMNRPYDGAHCCIARATVMADLPGLSGRAKTITPEEKVQFRAATLLDGALTRTVEGELQQLASRDAAVALGLLRNAVAAGTDAAQEASFGPTEPMREGEEPPTALLLVGNYTTTTTTGGEGQQQQLSKQINAFNARAMGSGGAGDEDVDDVPPMRFVELNRATMSGSDVLAGAVAEATSWAEGAKDFDALAAQFCPPEGAGGADSGGLLDVKGGGKNGAQSGLRSSKSQAFKAEMAKSSRSQMLLGGSGGGGQNSPGSGSTTGRSTGRRGKDGSSPQQQQAEQQAPPKPAAPEFLSFDEAVVAAMGFELFARERHRRVSREYHEAVASKTEAAMLDYTLQHEEEDRKRSLRRSLGKISAAEERREAEEAEAARMEFRESARAQIIESLVAVPPRPWTLYLITNNNVDKKNAAASAASASAGGDDTVQAELTNCEALAAALGDGTRNKDALVFSTPRPVPAASGLGEPVDYSQVQPLEKSQAVPYRYRAPASSLRILHCSPANITVRTNHALAALKASRRSASASATTVSDIFRAVLQEVAQEREELKRLALLPNFGPAGAIHGEMCLHSTNSLPDELKAALSQGGEDSATAAAAGNVTKWFMCVPAVKPAPSPEVKNFASRLETVAAALSVVRTAHGLPPGAARRQHPLTDEEELLLDDANLLDVVEGFRGLRDAEAFAFSRFSQVADAVTGAVSAPWENFSVEALSSFGPLTPQGHVLTAAAATAGANNASPSSGRNRRPPPLLQASKQQTSSNHSPPRNSSSNNNNNANSVTAVVPLRSNSPTSRLTPFMAETMDTNNNNDNSLRRDGASSSSSSAQREIVRHRLWQWYDNQRTAVISTVAEQLSATAFTLREMAILNVRSAAHCLRSIMWFILKDKKRGGNNNDADGDGAFGHEPSWSDCLDCPLSLWTSLCDELARQMPSLSKLCGGASDSHAFMAIKNNDSNESIFATVIPACRSALAKYASTLFAEAHSISADAAPGDVEGALLSSSSSERWDAFVAGFFDTHVAARISFVEQWREQLASAARKWIIYSADKYRLAVQSPSLLRAAVADVKRAQEVVTQQQQYARQQRRQSTMLPNSSSSPSSTMNSSAAAAGGPPSPAAVQHALAGHGMQQELLGMTDGFPRPATATVLMALEDMMRASSSTAELFSSSSSSSSPHAAHAKQQRQPQQFGSTATKSLEQRETELIARVVETQLFRDDGSNMAIGVSDATNGGGTAKKDMESIFCLHPPNIKLSSLQLRFLIMHFNIANAAAASSSSSSSSFAAADCNNNNNNNRLWTFVRESVFIHAMLSSQVCGLGRVLYMTSPLQGDGHGATEGAAEDESAVAAARRRNKLSLPTCAPSAFELFVPGQRWWGRKEAIVEAVACLRRGHQSAHFDPEHYAPPSQQQLQQQSASSTAAVQKKKRLAVPTTIVQPAAILRQQEQEQAKKAMAGSATLSPAAVAAAADTAAPRPPTTADGTNRSSVPAEEEEEDAAEAQKHGANMEGFADAEVLLGAADFGDDGDFMNELDGLLEAGGVDDQSGWFGATQRSCFGGGSSKPSTSQSLGRTAGGGVSRQSQRSQQQQPPPQNKNNGGSASHTPKPPSSAPPQQPRGAALVNYIHREAILAMRSSYSLCDDFSRMVSAEDSEKNSISNSSSDQKQLPLELFFVGLILNNGGSRPGEVTKICTVSDAAAVTRKIAKASGLYEQLLAARSPTPTAAAATACGAASAAYSKQEQRLFRLVQGAMAVKSVQQLAALPCFAQKSSIATTTGPSADMCTLWDILTLNSPVAHFDKRQQRSTPAVPFTRLLPLLASDDVHLSRCERRFVIASCFDPNSEDEESPGATRDVAAAAVAVDSKKSTPMKEQWQDAHTGTVDQLADEGVEVDAPRAPQIDSASLRVSAAQLTAAFLDEPVDNVVMQLVVRDASAGTAVSYHSHICSLWGQEAWARVKPRCLPTTVW